MSDGIDTSIEVFQRWYEDHITDEITALRARLEALNRVLVSTSAMLDAEEVRAERAEAALATVRRDDLVRLRDGVDGAQHWLTVSRFTNAEHARAIEQLAYVIAAMDALIAQEPAQEAP